ncbi:MAG: biotin--[acetyl-CoA-carboxylase] ligase [Verrucomicrobia bacterium]|nr:biotin--[acetyl-CoA-carboxylase] ligase [Verrucomicrobiota bacterium]MBS0645377.1 biotin--[acetyl-CoA-carboxylase] ligase [Verrucomicrobiota bacterium]
MQRQYHIFQSLDSTNCWAKRNLESFPHDQLTLITAAYQTQGRGTHGRTWHAPPHTNLLLTFVFFVDEQADPLRLTHLLGIAICTWLKQLGLEAYIKWPNDILVKGKKLAGILCETQRMNHVDAIILGLGLNVNMQDVTHIDQAATSLFLETGKMWELNTVLQIISDLFHDNLEVYKKRGFAPFVDSEIKVVKSKDQGLPLSLDAL